MDVLLRKAVIPLGGLGTRLRPLTVETSKALVRFLNRPLIEFTIVRLAKQGVTEFYMGVSGYLNYREVYDYFGEGLKIRLKYDLPNVRIRYQPNEESVGSADCARIIMDYYDIREPVLVVQGDLLFDLDLHGMWEFHTKKNSFMTIAVKYLEREEELPQFGVADIDSEERIRRFVEKPKTIREAPSRFINTGIYILSESFRDFLNSDIVNYMRQRNMMDFGQHIIPLAIQMFGSVYAYELKGYWFDIGTPERYLEAVFYLLRHMASEELEAKTLIHNVKVQGKSRESIMLHQEILSKIIRGEIKADNEILIGRHVKIGRNVSLSDSVVDNYTIIEDDVTINRSVIMDRCRVGAKTYVSNSIIGRHVKMHRNAKIVNSVIGDDAIIGENVVLVNTKVWPHKEISPNSHMENMIFS
ncbi:MAG: NDP-sugar synthase [Ignisphaera sp.]|nr:NDP-sugar synthase [Ignisphaera sp.]